MFQMVAQGPIKAAIIMRNAGTNQINYIYQDSSDGGTTWTDMAAAGTDLNNTLATGTPPTNVKMVTVSSSQSQARLIANATGGSTLEFIVTRYFNRATNGPLPLISL
jgi:hypothetical protein